MTTTEKIYIGKGNQVKDYDMFSIVLNLTEAKSQTFIAKNGDTLLRFTFARTKQPDNFGRTHTAYITPLPVKEEVKTEAEIKVPVITKKISKSKKAVTA